MIKISKVSKLDGINSWSLQAGDTCPGSHSRGVVVDSCRGCYAKYGKYCYSSVKASRGHNKKDWKRSKWVDDMVTHMDNSRYFRWFDSGDVYCVELARKILQVMERTPWVNHWLSTRSYKFPKIEAVLKDMERLPNVVVRRSSDDIDGTHVKGLHGAVIVPDVNSMPEGVHLCMAYAGGSGKCDGCRACWDKNVTVVGYVAHGMVMKKVIKSKMAA